MDVVTHPRNRIMESAIAKALQYSPAVGLMGMRQVGKTTLLKKFSKTYFTFDEPGFDLRFEKEGLSLIEKAPTPVALDEVQKHPPAFDAIKFSVDRVKKMGRFLLSGSVRFSSRRQIRESLTGRVVLFEILPLTLAECHSTVPSPFLSLIQKASNQQIITKLQSRHFAKKTDVLHYLRTGGLPGICFRRDEQIRRDLFSTHLDTLLGRDIHLIRQTELSLATLRSFVLELGRHQGEKFPVAQLARAVGIARLSATRLLAALEGLFLIRKYGATYYIEDAGLSHYLQPQTDTMSRNDCLRALYYELRVQFALYLRHDATMVPYQTRGGMDVPFFVEFKSGERVLITLSEDEVPTDKNLKTFTWLKKKFPKLRCIVLCHSDHAFELPNNILCLPWLWVF